MKLSITGPRNAANLSEAIHQQLNMYAIAAGAAGVGILALTQPLEAKIVYTPANVQISGMQHYDLDLNNDGITDFTITHFSNRTQTRMGRGADRYVDEKPATTSNGAIGNPPAALTGGAAIGHGKLFYGGIGPMADFRFHCLRTECTHHSGGNWLNVTNRYLGLRFKISGKTHYGWARLTFDVGLLSATLTGYAYETTPGKSIKAGQKKEATDESGEEDFGRGASLTAPIPDKPQPVSLGMLALGAQGVPVRRRKEPEGAASENN
jgi:hypothetical protein